jgi:pimeloyl-ACP methyl ester carboxylesterase
LPRAADHAKSFVNDGEPWPRSALPADEGRRLAGKSPVDGPIYNELPKLTVPTLLAIGQLDRTVFGRRYAPPEVVKPLGNFPLLGKAAQQRIPGAQLVEFDGVGHAPHLEVPERFHVAVLKFLADKP